MKRWSKSIRFKLLSITILILLVALAIASLFNYYQSRQALESYMEMTITTLASSVANEVNLWLEGRKAEVSVAALALGDYETQEEKLAFMHRFINNNRIYETMFLADEQGDYFITEGDNGNVRDRGYFQEVMMGKTVVSDPVISRATGRSVIVVATPLKDNDILIGLVGVTVSLDDLSNKIISRQIGRTGYPYLIQGDGLVIAHPDPETPLNLNTITDETLDQNLREAMTNVAAGISGISNYTYEGIDKYVAYTPISQLAWGLAVTVPESELHEQLANLPLRIALVTLVIMIIAAFVSDRFLIRIITNPIKKIQVMIARTAQGNLSVRGAIISEDELGQLTNDFNQFMEKVQQVIGRISDNTTAFNKSLEDMFSVTSNMVEISEEMENKTNAVNQAITQITESINETASASFEANDSITLIVSAVEEMNSTMQHQASATEQSSASIEHVSQGVNQISSSINSISLSAQDMSNSVNSVATAVKEINISLNEVSESCERSTKITDDAETKARETKGIIENLNISSRQIGKIVNVINDIADQTNMLALNAAIEAAGAGEAGRGFAVVANEVKELAKQTAEATDEIGQQIETMQGSMSNAVKAMETITLVIEESNNITGTIASAVAEQSATTGEISKSVILAAEKVNHITGEISEVAASTQQAAANISEVSKGVHDIARSTNELVQGANEVAENAINAAAKVAMVAKEATDVSNGAGEIAKSIHEISLASRGRVSVVEETSKSNKELVDLMKELGNLIRYFQP